MKIVNGVIEGTLYSSLALLAGIFLFTPGSLSVLALVTFSLMFAGSTGKLALLIYDLFPESDKEAKPAEAKINPDTVNAAEAYAKKNTSTVKPDVNTTATAQPAS